MDYNRTYLLYIKSTQNILFFLIHLPLHPSLHTCSSSKTASRIHSLCLRSCWSWSRFADRSSQLARANREWIRPCWPGSTVQQATIKASFIWKPSRIGGGDAKFDWWFYDARLVEIATSMSTISISRFVPADLAVARKNSFSFCFSSVNQR